MREHGTQRPLSEAGRPATSMGFVEPGSISPVVREYFCEDRWPRLSPYFEHKEYRIFVEAHPYVALIDRYPDEMPIYEQGYLWCTCYSTSCVNGERGHHHMSMLTPITTERFRAAQARAWHP